MLLVSVWGVTGCKDLVGTAQLPPGTQGPATYDTPDGALAAYQGVKAFAAVGHNPNGVSGGFFGIEASGALTDELAYIGRATSPVSIGARGEEIDERQLPEATAASLGQVRDPYNYFQGIRGQALEAIGLLRTYAPKASPALVGELQALEGYAEVLLGELYCSGVPLSTLDFEQDFTYKPGSPTTAVWQHAVALLDSASAVSSDSVNVVRFAQVVKGRALLDLGQYAAAAQAVSGVPDDFTYELVRHALPSNVAPDSVFGSYTVADREGVNGLPYVSSGDPRSAVVAAGSNRFGLPLYTPAKYPGRLVRGADVVVLASGVEARLIEAEADLKDGGSQWLTILNALRTDGTVVSTYTRTCQDGVSPCPAGVVDTTWGSGTGVYLIPASVQADQGPTCSERGQCTDTVWYKGLRPLTDPGTNLTGQAATAARVNLLFRERAYWLFVTAHRQGDLRRLVRNYGRDPQTVYPTGPYYGGAGLYGSDVTLPVPNDEQPNPLFQGCIDRHA
jgi:hypothetical protein